MLKNKFGMTKILVLVLSVLMLVSLVACNKADGPSTDDMNAAIQAAIDAANAEQAAKEAALAASIAADKAAQEAKDAALAESIAKEKAENDAALKKAQEEAKAAADAAAKASEAAKAAADKAAKEAADAAAKAASEAAKKAQEAADKQASELAAALEAAKAEALKAQEEASKAAEEASKAIAEASKAAEEAAKASSQLAETTVPAETTVVVPGETTVTPAVPVDKTEVLVAYSKLKTEYTYTKMAMFKADDYAELVMLFDKASLDLNNAATVEAATAVLETLKVDVAAVRSVENAAAEVAALVNALGDIETEVFTTQMEKIDEAQKAYAAVLKEYNTYFNTQVDKNGASLTPAAVATKLGINVADLNKADVKAGVLETYAKTELKSKMETLYNKYNGKISKFDTDDFAVEGNETLESTILNAYYIYRVLAVVNGGDLSDANVPTDWEWEVDKKGEYVLAKEGDKDPWGADYKVGAKKYDTDKPTEFFTTEQLMETFILPTLDVEFANYLEKTLLDKFTKAANALETKTAAYDVDLDDIVDALEAEFEALSFVEDYKGTATLEDAKNDAKIITIKAYIEAMGEYLEAAKVVEIENKAEAIELANEAVQEKIDEYMDKLSDTENATTIANLNAKIEAQNAKIAANDAALAAYTANVNATALLTFEEMLNAELAETKEYKDTWFDFYDFDAANYATEVADYLADVLATTIAKNFVEEIKVDGADNYDEDLADLIEAIVLDLEALRLRVSPYEDDEADATIFKNLRGEWPAYVEHDSADYTYPNTAVFEEVVAIIDAAIANIEATTTEGVEDMKAAIVDGDKKPYYFKDVNAYNYAVEKYEYAVEADYNAKAVIEATEGLVGITATAYPVEYLITAAEQVSETVIKAYVQAYTDVNAKLVDLPEVKELVTDGKKLITNDGATAFDKIKAQTSGVLADEVQKVANTYTGKIDSARTTFANNISKQKFDGTEYKFDVASFYSNNNKDTTGANVNVYVDRITGWAAKYNPTGFSANITTEVKNFEKNFFVTEGDISDTYLTNEATINYAKSKVVELWTLKLKYVKDITDEIAKYKNSYKALSGNNAGLFTWTEATNKNFKYDTFTSTDDLLADNKTIEVAGKSAEAVAYEAELDALLAKYIDYIMGVEIGDGKTTIYDGTGAKISGFKGDDDSKINYNLTKAENALKAYKKALFGTTTYIVTANNDSKKTVYKCADSEIFKAYNTIILKNTYGVTRPQVKVNITQVDNCTISVGNAYINSEFSITFTPAEGYFVEQYLITAGDGTTLASGYPKDNVKVKVNYANKLDETVNVTAVVKKLVAFEDKTVAFDVDPTDEKVEKKPTVTAPKWYAKQTGAKLKVVADNTATDDYFGINLKYVTVNFYSDAEAKVLIESRKVEMDKYDPATGEFTIGNIPEGTVKATAAVTVDKAPEFTVKVASDDKNVKVLSQNVTVVVKDSDATTDGDQPILWRAYDQVELGGKYTIKVAVKTGYSIKVSATCGDVSLIPATDVTLTRVEADTETYTDCDFYTFEYTLPNNCNKLVTLTITSVASES